MQTFVADYEMGKQQGRYIMAELPTLPFADKTFDLALCSQFLFLYSDNLSLEFHREAIETLCRVAAEVRIFPLLTYNATRSPYVDPVMDGLKQAGYNVTIERVPYEFQRGGNEMMRIIVD
jgi:ubiquinone/menaquinone biosynthesis C-methylase UbiE